MKVYAASEFLPSVIVTLFVIRYMNGQTRVLFLLCYFFALKTGQRRHGIRRVS